MGLEITSMIIFNGYVKLTEKVKKHVESSFDKKTHALLLNKEIKASDTPVNALSTSGPPIKDLIKLSNLVLNEIHKENFSWRITS